MIRAAAAIGIGMMLTTFVKVETKPDLKTRCLDSSVQGPEHDWVEAPWKFKGSVLPVDGEASLNEQLLQGLLPSNLLALIDTFALIFC